MIIYHTITHYNYSYTTLSLTTVLCQSVHTLELECFCYVFLLYVQSVWSVIYLFEAFTNNGD